MKKNTSDAAVAVLLVCALNSSSKAERLVTNIKKAEQEQKTQIDNNQKATKLLHKQTLAQHASRTPSHEPPVQRPNMNNRRGR